MEKQGMDRRKRKYRAGLLIVFALAVFPAVFSRADEADAGENSEPAAPRLEVRLETSPLNPVVNRPWSVFIMVKHPIPQEVNVVPPRFPPPLYLERMRTDTRLTLEEERWTRIEYLFVPNRAEAVSLGSFVVRTPFAEASTEGFSVRFRAETVARPPQPVFRWLAPVPAVAPGETAALVLELSRWNDGEKAPAGLFRGKAPLNAVVREDAPLAAGEGVYRYKISVIPLEETAVTLESFLSRFGTFTLTVPAITVPVLPAESGEAENSSLSPEVPAKPAEQFPVGAGTAKSPFPESREKVFFLFSGEYNRIIARVRSLWDENRRVEALAELRKNERDSLSGSFLVPLRREIEDEMGLAFTENEQWRPFGIPPAVYAILCAAVLFVPVFLIVSRVRPEIPARIRAPFDRIKKKNALDFSFPEAAGKRHPVTFGRMNGFIVVVVLILMAGLVLIILEDGMENFPVGRSGSSGSAAVLRNTEAYAVPDFSGTALDRFIDGQPVIVGGYRGDWCLAETPDGRSGWVPRESVITY